MDKIKLQRIASYVNELFPDAKAELNYRNHFELLIAVVLSAQTTDIAVNQVTPALFESYPTPYVLAQADTLVVESYIKRIGLYKNKAKNIIALSQALVLKYNGQVPSDRAALESLPGVGRKTANVVLSNAFDIPAFAVDTHVARISKRLGLANETDDVLKIEQKLMKHFDASKWMRLHHQFIFFGRYHCKAVKPQCDICALKDICLYFNQKNEGR